MLSISTRMIKPSTYSLNLLYNPPLTALPGYVVLVAFRKDCAFRRGLTVNDGGAWAAMALALSANDSDGCSANDDVELASLALE